MEIELIEAPQSALTLPQRAAVALGESANEAKLRELVTKSAGIVTVTNADGREEAHRACMVLLKTRTGIRATGKAARDDATKFSKAVIAMEDSLIKIIEPEEVRVLGLRDGFDAAEQARKYALIAAERARTDAIRARITDIRNLPPQTVGKSASEISAMIGRLANHRIDDSYEEFSEEAKTIRLEILDLLAKAETAQRNIEIEAESQRQQLAREKADREEEAERLAAERLALQQERAAMAERAEEQDRIAKASRDAAQAELKAAQDKFAAEQAEHQRQMDAQAAELQRKQAEADARDAVQSKAVETPKPIETIAQLQTFIAAKNERLGIAPVATAQNPAVLLNPSPSYPWPTGTAIPRPTVEQIIEVLALHFNVHESIAYGWLLEMSKEIEYL